MSTAEFWDATPKEFHYRQKGYFKKIERRERNEWERARWQIAVYVNFKLPKNKNLKPQEIALFHWEEKEEKQKNKLDPKQLKRIADAMDKHAKNPEINSKPVDLRRHINQ